MTRERSRWNFVYEGDQSLVLLTPVLRVEWNRYVCLLACGPFRVGFSWRRFA